jgi:hypothetical protein
LKRRNLHRRDKSNLFNQFLDGVVRYCGYEDCDLAEIHFACFT